MGEASMRKWVRRSMAANPWRRPVTPGADDIRYALHLRRRERERRRWDRRFAKWAAEGDGRSYTLTADGELLHIRTREPNCVGKITVDVDRKIYAPAFRHGRIADLVSPNNALLRRLRVARA